MPKSASLAYYKFPSEIRDRLSYGESHPEREGFYKVLKEAAKTEGRTLCKVRDIVQFIDEKVSPNKEYPHEAIMYLGLEDIKAHSGKATFRACFGRDILSMSKRLRRGNIVFARLRPYLNKAHIIEEVDEALGSGELLVVQPREEVIIPQFLLKYLLSDLTLTQTKWILTGSSYPRLDAEDFKNLWVILPVDKAEQTAILHGIESMEQEAEAKEAEANRLNEECRNVILNELGIQVPPEDTTNYFFKTSAETHTLWFTIFQAETTDRLHYLFFHPRYHILNELRDHYRTIPLAAICREPIFRGEQPDYDDLGTVTVLKTVDLHDGYIDYDNALKVSEDFFEAHPASHIRKNDILVASTGYVSMGKVDIYDRDEPATVDGHISVVRVNKDYDPFYIAYLLRCHFGRLQFEKWFTGSSGQIELQPTDLGEFIVPDSSENGISLSKQKRIAKCVTERLNKSRDLEQQAKAKWQEAKEQFVGMIFSKCTTQQEVP
jgi:restriction endonuclease S subunit